MCKKKDKFVKLASIIHNNKYTYELVIYDKNYNKVNITCPIHGSFLQRPKDHIRRKNANGCPKCYKETKKYIQAYPLIDFLNKSNKIHNYKYLYIIDDYINQSSNIKIICPIHNLFLQNVRDHMSGSGCQKCFAQSKRISKEKYIEKANLIHNNFYNYSNMEYNGQDNNINIICNNHGPFTVNAFNHLNKGGKCPKCSLEIIEYKKNKTKLKNKLKKQNKVKKIYKYINKKLYINKINFILKALKKFNNKYNYSKINYINNICKVEIICPNHNSFWQTPADHLNSKIGCQKCAIESRIEYHKYTIEEFILAASIKHNNKYTYDNIGDFSDGCPKKININCPRHKIFHQSPASHLTGKGCPKCFNLISKPEIEWLNNLNILIRNINIKIKNIKYKKINVDGFDPITNTVYFFHGDYWHGNPKKFNKNDINQRTKTTYGELYCKTIEKEELLKSAGYNVISMWEYDWKQYKKAI